MSEVTDPAAEPEGKPAAEEKPHEETVPYERFQQTSKKAKDAADRAKALERDLADLRSQMEERESAGLPELERLKKDMERAQKRADEAEARAQEADTKLQRTAKERWITAAAKDFDDPSDALAFVNLDEIEDEKDAERAVKRLAAKKPRLLKAEDPQLPGQVLKNGREPDKKEGGFNVSEEAQMLAEGLKQFASRS